MTTPVLINITNKSLSVYCDLFFLCSHVFSDLYNWWFICKWNTQNTHVNICYKARLMFPMILCCLCELYRLWQVKHMAWRGATLWVMSRGHEGQNHGRETHQGHCQTTATAMKQRQVLLVLAKQTAFSYKILQLQNIEEK